MSSKGSIVDLRRVSYLFLNCIAHLRRYLKIKKFSTRQVFWIEAACNFRPICGSFPLGRLPDFLMCLAIRSFEVCINRPKRRQCGFESGLKSGEMLGIEYFRWRGEVSLQPPEYGVESIEIGCALACLGPRLRNGHLWRLVHVKRGQLVFLLGDGLGFGFLFLDVGYRGCFLGILHIQIHAICSTSGFLRNIVEGRYILGMIFASEIHRAFIPKRETLEKEDKHTAAKDGVLRSREPTKQFIARP